MSYVVRLHPDADKEYADAYAWYEAQSEGLGERFIAAVSEKIKNIATRPETYGSKTKGYRETIVDSNFPFVIVYKVAPQAKQILIAAIYHQKRDPRKKYRK